MGICPKVTEAVCDINHSFKLEKDERSVPFVLNGKAWGVCVCPSENICFRAFITRKMAEILSMGHMNLVRLLGFTMIEGSCLEFAPVQGVVGDLWDCAIPRSPFPVRLLLARCSILLSFRASLPWLCPLCAWGNPLWFWLLIALFNLPPTKAAECRRPVVLSTVGI